MLGNANRRQSFLCGISAAHALSILCAAASGQCDLHEDQKLLAYDGTCLDVFGYSVSISGDSAVVGAPRDDDLGANSGSVYAYRFDGSRWVLEAKVLASDGATANNFGKSIIFNGDVALIGAPGNTDNGVQSGSLYVFQRDRSGTWTEVAELLASDGAAYDTFGIAASLSGNVAVVGASGDADNGAHTGSAYIFLGDTPEPNRWTQAAKLTASDGGQQDWFGFSVCISDDVAVIGAPAEDDNGPASGSAYVFIQPKDGWTDMNEYTELTAFDGGAGDNFGLDVAVNGDIIAAGAPRDDDQGDNSGSAYIFERNKGGPSNWGLVTKLMPSDGGQGDLFGFSVFLSNDMLLVGAPTDDNSSGSAYLYARDNGGRDNWGLVAKLTASDGARADSFFGFSTSIDNDLAILGATGDDTNGQEAGSAYIVELNCALICPWDLDGNGSVGAADLLALLVSWGRCKDCPADFDDDGNVGATDLLALLVNWGPCP